MNNVPVCSVCGIIYGAGPIVHDVFCRWYQEPVVTLPSSDIGVNSSSSQIQQTKTECRCPFGPNLGPIVHIVNCKERT